MIAGEACFFVAGALRPWGSLVIQVAKLVIVGGQWMVVFLGQRMPNGKRTIYEEWMVMLWGALLSAMLR
jgi:hypothetical protein